MAGKIEVTCNRAAECPVDCPCKKPHIAKISCLERPNKFFESGSPDHHRCNFSDCNIPATNFWKD